MTNPEKVISEQQTSDGSAPENEISNCAEIFCRAMSQLNAVALQQTEALLNIATSAAEKFHSLNSPATANKEELGALINQLKTAADNISQINQPTPQNSSAQPATSPATVLEAVEHQLSNAIGNSVNNQQQLNIIGAAILTQAAALLLSAGEKQS